MDRDDLERRLRSSLSARADDAQPTPDLWERVKARRERRVRRRWVAVGASSLAAVLAAAVVTPTIIDAFDQGGGSVRIDPPPVAGASPDPTPDVTPTVEPTADADVGPAPMPIPEYSYPSLLVTTDGRRIQLRSAEGEVIRTLYDQPTEGESHIETVAVRPGSTADDLTVVFLSQGEGMWFLRYLTFTGGVGGGVEQFPPHLDVSSDASSVDLPVVPAPVWSPDGDHLAWVESDADGARLRVIGWDDGPGTGDTASDNTSFDSSAAGAGSRAQEWVTVEGSPQTVLYVTDPTGAATGGEVTLYAHQLERQPDGAIAEVVAEGEPREDAVIDIAHGVGLPPATDYLLEAVGGGEGTVDLRIRAEGAPDEMRVPATLERTSDVTGIWMTAGGDAVLVGHGDAWLVLPGTDPRRIEDATYAVFVD